MLKAESMDPTIVGAPVRITDFRVVVINLTDRSFYDFAEGFSAQFRADLLFGRPGKGIFCAE